MPLLAGAETTQKTGWLRLYIFERFSVKNPYNLLGIHPGKLKNGGNLGQAHGAP